MATKFEIFMAHLAQNALTEPDKYLLKVFRDNDAKIEEHFTSSLVENNTWANYSGPPAAFFGDLFHEGFRREGILVTSELDTKVYLTIRESKAFWDAVHFALGEGK